SKLMPAQQAAIDADYEAALKLVPDGPAKSNGIAVGEQAATACLTRVDEGLSVPDTYRPHAAAGVYVPTMLPAVPNWGKRKPWVMTSRSQLRPAPVRLRRQVQRPPLPADHGHPQRRRRRQRRDRARSELDAVHRHSHAPGISVRPLHRVSLARGGAPGRARQRGDPDLELGEL